MYRFPASWISLRHPIGCLIFIPISSLVFASRQDRSTIVWLSFVARKAFKSIGTLCEILPISIGSIIGILCLDREREQWMTHPRMRFHCEIKGNRMKFLAWKVASCQRLTNWKCHGHDVTTSRLLPSRSLTGWMVDGRGTERGMKK